jgi:hypothetical protein
MLRRVCCQKPPAALLLPALEDQRRCIRYGSVNETLASPKGGHGGQKSTLNEIAGNMDAEDDQKKPHFRNDLMSKSVQTHSYLNGMYRWGFNSLSMFKKVNEEPGPWWNANTTTLVSTWTQIGDFANAGMWSGVHRYTYGCGQHNLRPVEARGRAWGRKFNKTSRALSIDYQDKLSATTAQKFTLPHTKEHQTHHRYKNPQLPGFTDIDPLQGKRLLREVQYHLGGGLRYYLVDGVFGSFNGSATSYRIITDNPTSAYFSSLAAIRKVNYVTSEEALLTKRVQQSPAEEWAWRRPSVLVYHAPSFGFEQPRIVEEFGGPRPQDFALSTPKFVALDQYSIPMRGAVGAEPKSETLLETIALLCARWGYYADERNHITLKGDAVIAKDGVVTIVIGDKSDALKASVNLFAAHHLRLDNNYASRAWDVTSVPLTATTTTGATDLVEVVEKRVQKALPTRLGLETAVSHRAFSRRRVAHHGYKRPHNYTDDVATRADQAGHLFNGAAKNKLSAHAPRVNAVGLGSVNVVVLGEKASTTIADVVATIVDQFKAEAFLYAEPEKLSKTLADVLSKAKSVKVVPKAAAAAELEKLAKTGSM